MSGGNDALMRGGALVLLNQLAGRSWQCKCGMPAVLKLEPFAAWCPGHAPTADPRAEPTLGATVIEDLWQLAGLPREGKKP